MNGYVVLQRSQHPHWLRFYDPIDIITTTDLAKVPSQLHQIDKAVNQRGLYAAGFISYEAAPAFDPTFRVREPASLPLLWFGLYRQAEPSDIPVPEAYPYTLGSWLPTVGQADYEQAIARVKDYIARGETYQVNYTIRLRTKFSGDPWVLFLKLAHNQRGQYAAYVDTGQTAICSASPELFFRRAGSELVSKPMKGTAARGKTLVEDEQQIAWLQNSEKNRAENVMIVDMIRNDMGRISEVGTVRVPHLFEIERYPTVLQMTSTVTARSTLSTSEVIAALFPCSSITGAPKVRTMEIIAELETEPRGVYTGCIGFISPGHQARFNVAIRTVTIDQTSGLAEYGVGGGIVWDSETTQEYQECQIKARVLTEERPNFDLLETILWEPETDYFLLEEHLGRLVDSAKYFNIPVDRKQILARLQALSSTLHQTHRVRLLVSQDGSISTQAIPLDRPPVRSPWRVALAVEPIDSSNPFLYHKTTNRQVYEAARAAQPGYDDVLLWNERGEITEATIANVVVKFGHELFTPPVQCGLLAGTYRAHLLTQNVIRERVITVAELRRSDQVFLINSVRKWIEAELHPPQK